MRLGPQSVGCTTRKYQPQMPCCPPCRPASHSTLAAQETNLINALHRKHPEHRAWRSLETSNYQLLDCLSEVQLRGGHTRGVTGERGEGCPALEGSRETSMLQMGGGQQRTYLQPEGCTVSLGARISWCRCDVGMKINIELEQRFTGGRAHCGLWEEGKTSLGRWQFDQIILWGICGYHGGRITPNFELIKKQ